MRKLILVSLLVLGGSAAGFFNAPAAASGGGGSCVTYCSTPNACGYVCCYQQCSGNRCVDLDCAPPPPCDGSN